MCLLRLLFLLFFCWLSISSLFAQSLAFQNQHDFFQFFTYSENSIPLVSAHRGGLALGYPENCLETFEHTISKAPVLIECDVNMTKDSVLFLMHDATLDRTTSSKGKVSQMDWEEIKSAYLLERSGGRTTFKAPTLNETLEWARGKTVLTLDVKRGVPFEKVIQVIRNQNASLSSIVIVYNLEDARKVHELAPNILISANIRSQEELERILDFVPANRLLAFTGTSIKSKSFYQALHEKGIKAILGTLGNLDSKAEAKGDRLYRRYVKKGVDIIATDRPVPVWETIKGSNLRSK